MSPGRWDHSYRVLITERPVYLAHCSYCGFDGPERKHKSVAESDMDAHVRTPAHQQAVRAPAEPEGPSDE